MNPLHLDSSNNNIITKTKGLFNNYGIEIVQLVYHHAIVFRSSVSNDYKIDELLIPDETGEKQADTIIKTIQSYGGEIRFYKDALQEISEHANLLRDHLFYKSEESSTDDSPSNRQQSISQKKVRNEALKFQNHQKVPGTRFLPKLKTSELKKIFPHSILPDPVFALEYYNVISIDPTGKQVLIHVSDKEAKKPSIYYRPSWTIQGRLSGEAKAALFGSLPKEGLDVVYEPLTFSIPPSAKRGR